MSNKQINLSDFSDEQNMLEDDLLNKIKDACDVDNETFEHYITNDEAGAIYIEIGELFLLNKEILDEV